MQNNAEARYASRWVLWAMVLALLFTCSCGRQAQTPAVVQVVALCYHRVSADDGDKYTVSPEILAGQVQALIDRHYVSINPGDYLAWLQGEKSLPARCFMLTFDDGLASDYEVVYPFLKKLDLRAGFFPVVGFLDHPGRLTSEQLRTMARDERCFIGSHALTHKKLPLLQPDELGAELSGSKQRLEQIIGAPVRTLAYPYGFWSRDVIGAARQSGYALAFTAIAGMNHRQTDPMELRRLVVQKSFSANQFARLIDFDPALYRAYYTQLLARANRFGDQVTADVCRQELARLSGRQ